MAFKILNFEYLNGFVTGFVELCCLPRVARRLQAFVLTHTAQRPPGGLSVPLGPYHTPNAVAGPVISHETVSTARP